MIPVNNETYVAINKYLSQANTMLAEVEMEGEIVNQSWHEYDNFEVVFGEADNILSVTFYIGNRKAGAFITHIDDIQKCTLYQEDDTLIPLKHVYLHLKGKEKEALLVNGMIDLFINKVPLEDNFSLGHLYNVNRSNAYISDKTFLKQCYDGKLFTIHKYEIEIDETKEKERFRVFGNKDYAQENEQTVIAFLDMMDKIEEMGIEVMRNKRIKDEENSVYARGYVPDWKMILSANSQDISTILETFIQKDKRVCIISPEWNPKNTNCISVYLVERSKKFYEVYQKYEEAKIMQQISIMEKFSAKFNRE